MNNTTTQQKEFAFKCGYCSFMRATEGSKVVQFDDGKARICKGCVEKTEEYRDRLPIVEE